MPAGRRGVVTPRAVRRLRKDLARRHDGTPRTERAYLVGLTVLVGAAVVGGVLRPLLDDLAAPHGGVPRAAPGTLLALGAVGYGVLLWVSSRVGPVSGGRATLALLATSPLPRGGLLRPTVAAILAVASVLGGVHGLLVVAVLKPPPGAAAAAVVTAAAGAVLTMAAVVVVQSVARRPAVLLAGAGVVSWVFAALVLVVAPGNRLLRLAWWSGPWGWPLAMAHSGAGGTWAVVAAAAIGAGLALGRVARIPLGALAAGSAAVETAAAGAVALDPGLALRASEERSWAGRRPARTGLPHLTGTGVVLAHDLRTLGRTPGRVLAMVGIAGVPALLVGVVGHGLLLAAAWAACGLVATGLFTANARRDQDMPQLGRLLGFTPGRLLAARAIVPAAVGAVYAALSLALVAPAGLPGWAWWWAVLGVAAGPALAVAALRSARRGPVRHHYPPLVTPVGLIPTGPLLWLVAGPDLGVFLLLPVIAALRSGHAGTAPAVQAVVSVVGLAAFLIGSGRANARA
ncbi:MAG: hypothetical protein JWN54_259 [Mycobacterium sp.]|nr:hypothetical protein [Mycobacterium sp.]